MSKTKKIIHIAFSLVLLVGVFTGGAFFGFHNGPAIEKVNGLFNKETVKPADIDFSPFWVAWNTVESKFVSNDNLDRQKMVWGAIEGMVNSLGDPYSVFFPPEESKMFKEDISGDFSGVGMEIGIRNDVLTVIAPLKGTPAYKAGIKSGDKILQIDDVSSADMRADEAARLIRGERGTAVRLTLLREGNSKSFEVTIIRDIINIPVLDTETRPGGVFIIKMYNFSATSAGIFKNALREFINSGNDKLILDLRNNPGGYLESAVDIASWFLPAGKIITREKFNNEEENIFRSKGYDIFDGLPMIILINNGSASASEILAGALQEHGIAKLVGEKTFGKGSVQELVQITPETSLKITIAKWLTPNGHSISDEGLSPDVEVELTEEDFDAGKDPQMEKALEMINN